MKSLILLIFLIFSLNSFAYVNYFSKSGSDVTLKESWNLDLDGTFVIGSATPISSIQGGTANNTKMCTQGYIDDADAVVQTNAEATAAAFDVDVQATAQAYADAGDATIQSYIQPTAAAESALVQAGIEPTAAALDDAITVSDIADTDLVTATPADNDVLTYVQSSGKWEPKVSSASVSSLNNIGDVTIASATPGQYLVWSGSLWQNQTKDFDWTSTTMTIEAVTTNPSRGTGVTEKCYYKRVGDTMFVQWHFHQTGAGSAGSGTYLFKIPESESIDTTKMVVNSDYTKASHVGTGMSYADNESYLWAYDSTHIAARVTTTNTIGSAFSGLNNATQYYSFTYSVIISGW